VAQKILAAIEAKKLKYVEVKVIPSGPKYTVQEYKLFE
jgi:hypothetical protein